MRRGHLRVRRRVRVRRALTPGQLIGRVLVADWVRGAVLCQTTLLVEQPTEGFKERVFEALEAKVASLTQDRVQLAPTW